MSEAALLIKFTQVLNTRYINRTSRSHAKDTHGKRAWNRLDHHMYSILQLFVTPKERFRKSIDWPEITSTFNREFDPARLATLFILDVQFEMCCPGFSRGLNGLTQDHVNVPKEIAEADSKSSQIAELRAMFTANTHVGGSDTKMDDAAEGEFC